ncbi:hypothetical protein [Nonomuraea indica]|uniref:hypothetical protein n=1 Tax=Nonomuraea indica TaxID=1581193 RepID=UPI001C5D4628|nr:hypothetical protein [Nonomuraea indica]
MADCERGLGRPERALDLVRSPEAERLDRAERIELAIVESGARRDLNQHDAAVITLQRLPELRDPEPKPWSARLAFAYADALADAGHQEAATDWFAKAMAFDEDGETDAAERYAELTGAVIEDLEEDFDDETDDAVDQAEEQEERIEDEAALAEADDLLTDDADIEDADDAEPRGRAASGDLGGDDLADGTEADLADDVTEDDLGDDGLGPDAADETETRDLEDADIQDAAADAEDAEDVDEAEDDADDEAGDDGLAEARGAGDDVMSQDNPKRPASGAPGASVAEGKPVEGTSATGKAVSSTQPEAAPDINLAFIEPDFGDILDEPEDAPTADRPKRDD